MALIGNQKFLQDHVRVISGAHTTIEANGTVWTVKPAGAHRSEVYTVVVRQFQIQGYKVVSGNSHETKLQLFAKGAYETPGPTAKFSVDCHAAPGHADIGPGHGRDIPGPGVSTAALNLPSPTIPADVLQLVQSGNLIAAIKRLREANPGMPLREAKQMAESFIAAGLSGQAPAGMQGSPSVQATAGTMGADATGAVPTVVPHIIDQIETMLRAGQKIQAIKTARDANPGMGLQEAKEYVEAIETRLGLATPSSGGGGCVGVLVFAVASAATLGAVIYHVL